MTVPHLKDDLQVLNVFSSKKSPPWRFARGNNIVSVHYGFRDAAKAGFGASFQLSDSNVWFRTGVWGTDEESNSSNFRELSNLVESLEALSEDEGISGLEIFLFTDNSTAEAAFYKGTSGSAKLFELVKRLRLMEMQKGVKIHFVHVAGTRMIAQGTDGLSRGDLSEGIMKGDHMLTHVPLHLSCLQRSPGLEQWLESCITLENGQKRLEFLTASDWFVRGHDISGGEKNSDGIWIPKYESGTFVWTPPPAGAWIAIEQLRRARVKREISTHVVVVPKLMAPEWRRQLFKAADLVVELPFFNLWTKDAQHEPLVFAVVFPFLSFRPWQLKNAPAFLGMGRLLRRLWKADPVSVWHVLQQFFTWSRSLATLSEGVVRKMLSRPPRITLLHSPS